MRSLGDVLDRSEERQNLKSGGTVIAMVCAVIVVLFLAMSLNLGLDPGISGSDNSAVQTTDTTD